MNRPLRYLAFALALPFIACGGDDDEGSVGPNVILSATVTFTGAATDCATGGVTKDFNGQAGKSVTITASGASTLTPVFTLYAPDFATQIAASIATGPGRAAATQALSETGVYHASFCDANGASGQLTVKVTS